MAAPLILHACLLPSYYEDEHGTEPRNTLNLRFVSDLRRAKEQPQELLLQGPEVSTRARFHLTPWCD